MAYVLATIKVESNFNPNAYSIAGAVGLMQVVPKSAGKSVWKFLYQKDMIPSKKTLFKPHINIKAGCTYMWILKNTHFKSIIDLKSQLYCRIAAYHTGPYNVARCFVNRKMPAKEKILLAVNRINTMSSLEVYNQLTYNLPYYNTVEYLEKILILINHYSQRKINYE